MPDKLTIRINVKPTDDPNDAPDAMQTVSHFSVEPKGHVTFTNDANASATVVFGSPSPLCAPNGTQIPQLTLGTSGPTQNQKNMVCDTTGLFKYTATVTGAAEEDPILIVENRQLEKKPIFFPEGIPMLLIGGLVGAIVGYLVAKRLVTRSPRPT